MATRVRQGRAAGAGHRTGAIPRFHVGESLLPYNHGIFEELGPCPYLEREGFPSSAAPSFIWATAARVSGFIFRQGCFTRHTEAFQVERAKFDDLLLRHAATSGAEARGRRGGAYLGR